MRERLAKCHPEPTIHGYVMNGHAVPLLVWLRAYEGVVTALIQEYLHVVFHMFPECRVWHWTLLSTHFPPTLVGRRFRTTEMYPSFHSIRHAVCGDGVDPVTFADLEVQSGRLLGDPDRIHMDTVYGDTGVTALWLGDEVFFYVADADTDVFNVRLPHSHRDLPPWVVPLLQEHAPRPLAGPILIRNVDAYLENLAAHARASDAVALLRRVNWGQLPLLWRPMRLRGTTTSLTVTVVESRAAQRRLIANMGRDLDDAFDDARAEKQTILDETLTLLGYLTGVSDDSD